MFTPTMTSDEIQQVAYKDFLEMRTRVQIAFERFVNTMKISGKDKRAIHSLNESHTFRTRAMNTWNINFRYSGYTPDGKIWITRFLYIPLRRENGVDYLFLGDLRDFKPERLSSHFLQRYRERYLDLNGIDLKGMHPALYFLQKNEDRRLAGYVPKGWTGEELLEKFFLVSEQGLSLVKVDGKMTTYITFLDQENLSRYKAEVFEEEECFKMLRHAVSVDILGRQAICKKLCEDIEHTREILTRFARRIARTKERQEMLIREYDKALKIILDETVDFEDKWNEAMKKYGAKSMLDFGVEKIADQLRAPSEWRE